MEEDEEDIWEEKSLRKLKESKKNLSPIRKACNKSSKSLSKNVGAQDTESGQEGSRSSNRKQLKRKRTGSSACNSRRKQQKSPVSTRATPQKISVTDGFCPKCQMPFSAMIGQSPGWHVRECLEAKYSYIGDCKDGIHCKSTFSPHFKRYSHALLATTRSYGIFENTNKEKTNESSSRQLNFSGQDVIGSRREEDLENGNITELQISSDESEMNSPLANHETCNNRVKKELNRQGNQVTQEMSEGKKGKEISKSSLLSEADCKEKLSGGLMDEDFGISSDEDLFGEPMTFSSLSEILGHGNQHRGQNEGTFQCLDNSSQAIVTKETGASPVQVDMPKTQPNDEGETSSTQTSSSQRQLSMMSFVTKSKAIGVLSDKSSMKQTDIGVFFGLKPLARETEIKLPSSQNDANSMTSSQPSTMSHRYHGGWRRGNKPSRGGGKTNSGYGSGGQSSGPGEDAPSAPQSQKSCPFYKKIPGSVITVDAFRYGDIPGCRAYFLSHFHYDHYAGLNGKFSNPIYCSKITANLVISKLYVKKQFVHPLPMNSPTAVQNVEVTLLEANHCPGAVLFLFKMRNGQVILHTGDFRASTRMENYAELQQVKIDVLYLDTTYCNPEYSFPSQEEAINFAVNTSLRACRQNPKTLIVCGSYTIGKERVFLAIADALRCKVSVEKPKKRILDCLESDHISSVITTDWKAGQIHVLPMAKLTLQSLSNYLESHKPQFTELLAFKPTGWEHSSKRENLSEIRPSKRGNVTVYGVPYSEHSSFSELERFVKFVQPKKIIPTVNNYSAESRAQMQATFNKWLQQ